MRILYSHRIQSRDGQGVHVEELITAFLQEGHEVRVVGPSFYGHAGFGGGSAMVARLRKLLPGALGELAELAYNLPAYLRLRRACREFRPDLIYERYNLYYLAGAWLARRTGLPYFLEVNSPLAEERIRFGGLRLHRLAYFLERLTWRGATRVLAVTGVLKDMIAASGIDPARIEVVQNGVVLDRFLPAPFAPSPDPGAAVALGFVGFVRPWHGLDRVIRAIAAHPQAQDIALTVIGDGPARPELERLAGELGLAGRVRFTGVVDHVRVPDLVASFDIALQPQVVAYASPLKIFDYMAAGRAIVAPDQPNIREILDHERTALLFDPADTDAMWRAVARLIDDPALRARMGQAARAELERRGYTWRGNARRITGWAGAQAVNTP
jgi:glycosyltransferase involved in cell wall biosynthesis